MPGTAQHILERGLSEPPWYFHALENRVKFLEAAPHTTDIAVLTAKVAALSEDVRTLRNAVYVAGTALGALVAYLNIMA